MRHLPAWFKTPDKMRSDACKRYPRLVCAQAGLLGITQCSLLVWPSLPAAAGTQSAVVHVAAASVTLTFEGWGPSLVLAFVLLPLLGWRIPAQAWLVMLKRRAAWRRKQRQRQGTPSVGGASNLEML